MGWEKNSREIGMKYARLESNIRVSHS